MNRPFRAVQRDTGGAVFIEKLIALLPLLLTFFLGWELAEVGAASLVVQRASAAAGRAAMVVLPDDPVFYADEPTDRYEGARRAEVELAAGMVLSSIPQLTADFEVDVSEPPRGFGKIDVTVRAPYQCGSVGLICGLSDSLTLSATTSHAYHGARYAYSAPTDVGSTGQSLTSGGATPAVSGTVQALSAKAPQSNNSSSPAGKGTPCGPFQCDPDGSFASNRQVLDALRSRGNGTKIPALNTPPIPGQPSSLQDRVRAKRCQGSNDGRNRAALAWECRDPQKNNAVVHSGVEDGVSGPKHAELAAFDAYTNKLRQIPAPDRARLKCAVTEIYTEREPCEDCKNAILGILRVQGDTDLSRVTYSFDFNPSSSVDPAVVQDLLEKTNACELANTQASKPGADPEKIRKRLQERELEELKAKLKAKATADAKKQCSPGA